MLALWYVERQIAGRIEEGGGRAPRARPPGALRGSVQRRAGDGSDLQTVPLALSLPRPGESFVVGGGRGSDKQNQRRSEPASAGSLSHKRLRPITLSLTLRAHTQTSTDSELEFSPAPPELVCGCKAQE